MNITDSTSGRYLKKKKGAGVRVGGPEKPVDREPRPALGPLGVLHIDPAAWGRTLALNP